MSWIDVFPVLLLAGYGVGGYFSGMIRRVIGLVALFAAFWSATNMGLQAGGILQQSSNFETPDGRIFGFFGILFGLLIIVEVATQIAHKQVQIPAIVLNRTLGAVLGVITAFVLSVVIVYELQQASSPVGGAQLTAMQNDLKTAIHNSLFMVRFTDAVDGPVIGLFQPVLPTDPQTYFGPGPVS